MEIHNLVAGLVPDDEEHGAVAGFDAIFDEGSDPLVHLLPHCLFAFMLRFEQFFSQLLPLCTWLVGFLHLASRVYLRVYLRGYVYERWIRLVGFI